MSNFTIKEIKQTLEEAKENKKIPSLSGMDLSGMDLSGLNLSGADLSFANLDRCKLFGTNLHQSDLTGATAKEAQCRRAIMINADLSNADFTKADLEYATLHGANLTKTNLRKVWLSSSDIEGIAMRLGTRYEIVLYPTLDGWMIHSGNHQIPLERAIEAHKKKENNWTQPTDTNLERDLCELTIFLENSAKNAQCIFDINQKQWGSSSG